MPEGTWVEVGTATTNRTPDSNVDIFLDLDKPRICSNMTDAEFRESFLKSKAEAVALIQARMTRVLKWDASDQARAKRWLGSSDDRTRSILQSGLPRLLKALEEVKPENVIRWDQQSNRNLSCAPLPDDGLTDASVCKPDSEKRIIAIFPHFCTSPRAQRWHSCQVLTLIHECTHFTDVFDSTDDMYGVTTGLSYWAQANPEKAIRNAESLACYVGFEE